MAMFAVDSVPDRPPVAADTRLLVEELQFLSPRDGMNRVWINAVIEADRLIPTETPDGQYRYRVEARWVLVDAAGESQIVNSTVEATTPRILGRDESLPVRLAADLRPGEYRYALMLRDSQLAPGSARPFGQLPPGRHARARAGVRGPGPV